MSMRESRATRSGQGRPSDSDYVTYLRRLDGAMTVLARPASRSCAQRVLSATKALNERDRCLQSRRSAMPLHYVLSEIPICMAAIWGAHRLWLNR